MTPPTSDIAGLPLWQAMLLLAPCLASLGAALLAAPSRSAEQAWRWARSASAASLGLAATGLLALLAAAPASQFLLRADLLGSVVLLLVTFIGWVILRYSRPYLDGDEQGRHYVRWLMATLAAVSLVIVTNHLLVLALAWMATSFALHRLLTFFRDRPAAVVAAHKKNIVGRLADVAMLAAVALFAAGVGTLQIDQIAALAAASDALPLSAQAAVVLVAIAALLKCAQLPFHGWLIQVMEAPTPVSALLHAGVVNLGGFVLMRLAPAVAEVTAAQGVLVVVGALTAVLAALVMTTRISIKVQLAWSTCAQMGFMLMQCGLGAWEMALLHLLAHSLYKAHAFLAAGGAVARANLRQLTPATAPPTAGAMAFGAAAGIGMTIAAGALWTSLALIGPVSPGNPISGTGPMADPAIWVLAGIVAMALVPLLQARALRLRGAWLPSLLLGAFGVALAYFVLHSVMATWVLPALAPAGAAPMALWVFVALAFLGLFALQTLLAVAPASPLVRRLYPWFYGGLFLDEQFTRIAFGLWAPPAPRATAAPLPRADASIAVDLDQPSAATGARS
jgi:NAD(P)H-quinone oxidoreductase subunit 5